MMKFLLGYNMKIVTFSGGIYLWWRGAKFFVLFAEGLVLLQICEPHAILLSLKVVIF